MSVIALFLALAAFACLLASMTRHQNDWFGRRLSRKESLSLRGAGFGLLALSGAGLTLAGGAEGFVLWLGILTAAAAAVIGVNSWRTGR